MKVEYCILMTNYFIPRLFLVFQDLTLYKFPPDIVGSFRILFLAVKCV